MKDKHSNDADMVKIELIAKRYMDRLEKMGVRMGDKEQLRLTVVMDLDACHANGWPLDLDAMLTGRSVDMMHDISGINQHLNRDTYHLGGCFVPRLAQR